MTAPLLAMPNASAVPLDAVPSLDLEALHVAIAAAIDDGCRISALFGRPDGDAIELVAVLADDDDGMLRCGRARLATDDFPSLTPACAQVHLFERELAEQWGVVPIGHPWLKPVRFHRSYRPGHDAWQRATDEAPIVGVTDFFRVDGEEVHEVAVGPVHAGVIEPGHFRFQCHGEQVLHLEISLGYQHRGVERRLVGGPDKRTIHYMETLAGDTTVGTRPRTARSSRRSPAGARRRAPTRYARSPSSSSGSPTTPATWAPSPAMSASCRPPPTAVGCAVTSST